MGYRRLFIMRKDLNMSAGKLAAQVGHCAEAYWTRQLRGKEVLRDNTHYEIEHLSFDKELYDGYWQNASKSLKSIRRLCAPSAGGGDSDVMLDMLVRCGAKGKTDFVFFNTGLEYQATLEHLDYLEDKYGIRIVKAYPVKPIPVSNREYGVPFMSKFAAEMIYRLQRHNFQWEDRPFDELYAKYPKCKTALEWWCNVTYGNTTQYAIKRNPYLKEFMVQNHPTFKISSKCCTYAKKNVAAQFAKGKGYDLSCIGIRQSEGGVRSAALHSCFSDGAGGMDYFRPIFWLRDTDKEEYCRHYDVTHSRCYTEYGLVRTGCFGCPFGKRFEEELASIEQYEPKLLKAANAIFKDSYEYTRAYLKFRGEMKQSGK